MLARYLLILLTFSKNQFHCSVLGTVHRTGAGSLNPPRGTTAQVPCNPTYRHGNPNTEDEMTHLGSRCQQVAEAGLHLRSPNPAPQTQQWARTQEEGA